MLPPRQPLTPLNPNRSFNGHLSPGSRRQIVAEYNCGYTPLAIALGHNLSISTTRYTIKKSAQRTGNATLPKKPRKKTYSHVEERNILRFVRTDPKATYAQVKKAVRLKCSTTTIKRILRENGILNWRAKRRPFLSDKAARKRLA
jgi:hypothetical protein